MVSKEHILETSCRLFRERGCKSVTMDDIAAECGISKRTLYEQFGDKSALLRGSIEMMGERYGARIEKIRQNSANVLEFLFNMHAYQTDFRMDTYYHFFADTKKYYPEVFEGVISKMREKNYEKNRELILQGQSQGIFHTFIDTDIMVTILSEIVNGINDWKKDSQYDIDWRKMLGSAVFLFLRGISTLKGIEMIDENVKKIDNKDRR